MPPDQFIEARIRNLPLFARLLPEDIDHVADAVRVLRFQPGQVIFHQGQTAQGMYLIVSGTTELIQTLPDGQTRVLGRVGENQFLNEAALLRPTQESATLRVLEETIVMVVQRNELLSILGQHPEIGPNLPPNIAALLMPQAPQPASPGSSSAPSTRPPIGTARPRSGNVPPSSPVAQPRIQPSAPMPSAPRPVSAATTTPSEQAASPKRLFNGQRDGEIVVVNTRRHWWAYVRKVWLPAVIGLLMVIAAVLMPSIILTIGLLLLALFLPGLLMLYFYAEWHNDQIIVTNQRVIRIERSLTTLDTSINEVPLSSIQEVSADLVTADLFSRIFDFGTVAIKTAGDAGNIRLSYIPKPGKLQKIIFDYRSRQQEAKTQQQRDVIRDDIQHILSGQPIDAAAPRQASSISRPAARSTHFTNELGEAVYRKHILFWIRAIFWPAVWTLGAFIFLCLCLVVDSLQNLGLLGPLLAFCLMVIGGLWVYWGDWDWRNDLYIVGDETIKIIHRRPLWLQNDNDQVLLNRVDSISSQRQGLLQSMFNYGNVEIALVGTDRKEARVFRSVPNPQAVQDVITRRRDDVRRRGQQQDDRRRREEIAEYLSVYHETYGGQVPPGQQATGQSAPPPVSPSPTEQPPESRPVRDRTRPPGIPRARSDQ